MEEIFWDPDFWDSDFWDSDFWSGMEAGTGGDEDAAFGEVGRRGRRRPRTDKTNL